MDKIWCVRCLNDHIDLPNIIVLFASRANASLVAKIGKNISFLWIISSPVDRFGCLRCLNDHIDLLDMIGSFVSGAAASAVEKIGT